jgi:DNA-binding MarR family transcriptional regulator
MQHYLECVSDIERLHRLFLDVVKAELDAIRVRDINNVQSLILYSIGVRRIGIGELTRSGYFLGSNVSYNLKKMAEAGYLDQERSLHDRRGIDVSLTGKGRRFWHVLDAIFRRHYELLAETQIDPSKLATLSKLLKELDRFWNLAHASVPRPPEPLVGQAVSVEQAQTYFAAAKRTVSVY